MSQSYLHKENLDLVTKKVETGEFFDDARNLGPISYNAHHMDMPREVLAVAAFQQFIRPALLENDALSAHDFIRLGVEKVRGTPEQPALDTLLAQVMTNTVDKLNALYDTKLLLKSQGNAESDLDTQFSLSHRGNDFNSIADIYVHRRITLGCLGSLTVGTATTAGAVKLGIPLSGLMWLIPGAYCIGGVTAVKKSQLVQAISAQKKYSNTLATDTIR